MCSKISFYTRHEKGLPTRKRVGMGNFSDLERAGSDLVSENGKSLNFIKIRSMKKVAVGICLLACMGTTTQAQRVGRRGVRPVTVSNNKTPHSLNELQGKWQEVARKASNGNEYLPFTDTLQLKFEGSKVEMRDATSMRIGLKGIAEWEDARTLLIAGDEMSVLKLDSLNLVLNDGEWIHEMQRKNVFYSETVGKTSIPQEILQLPVTVTDIKTLRGKWLIYRRDADAGTRNVDQVLIKSIELQEFVSDNKATGEVVFYASDVSEVIPCTFIFNNGDLTILSDKYNWSCYTYKATETEFVFGEQGRLMYYAKH